MLRPLRICSQMPYVALNWAAILKTVKPANKILFSSARTYCVVQKPKKPLNDLKLDEDEEILTRKQNTLNKPVNYAKETHSSNQKAEDQERNQHSQEHNFDEENRGNQEKKENRRAQFLPSIKNPFESVTEKNKNTYLTMVEIFIERDKHRRNHVEFIYAALKNMPEFGVEYDLEVYKALINVMPKGKFIPTNMFQAEFMHYPKQQQCIIDLLEQMEDYGVMPDPETEIMLLNVFGRKGHPLRKYWRMMYWMPKFRNLSPWPLPEAMPADVLELAKMAVERMCTVDLRSKITVYETKEIQNAIDKTWVVSGMSVDQGKLLQEHPRKEALYIEGPFLIWLRNRSINYFTLRSEPQKKHLENIKERLNALNDDDVTKLNVPIFGTTQSKANQIGMCRSVHQQDDGTIFAICATGTSTKDSLLSWVRLLEANGNPVLGEIPILFRFKSNVIDKEALIDDGQNSVINKS